MKLLNNIGKEILNRAIVLERFGWPPSCMGGVYQPSVPFVTIPSRIMKLLPKNPTSKIMDTKTSNEASHIPIWNIQKSRLRSFLLFSPQIFLT